MSVQEHRYDVPSAVRDWDVPVFCKRHGIERLALFGSIVGDGFGPGSDIDVLAPLDRSRKPSLYDLVRIRDDLQARFDRRVDVIDEKGLRNPFRRAHIMRTRRVLYDAG